MYQLLCEVEGFGDVMGNGFIVVDGVKVYLIDMFWDWVDIQVIYNWLDVCVLLLFGVVVIYFYDDVGGNLDVFY